jgi:hypothetical protein
MLLRQSRGGGGGASLFSSALGSPTNAAMLDHVNQRSSVNPIFDLAKFI